MNWWRQTNKLTETCYKAYWAQTVAWNCIRRILSTDATIRNRIHSTNLQNNRKKYTHRHIWYRHVWRVSVTVYKKSFYNIGVHSVVSNSVDITLSSKQLSSNIVIFSQSYSTVRIFCAIQHLPAHPISRQMSDKRRKVHEVNVHYLE